jgi:fructosamine-3-kinase
MSPSSQANVPSVFLHYLQIIEPNARFQWSKPTITSSTGSRYFAKIGSSLDREQIIGEAESLKALDAAAPGLVPKLIAAGFVNSNGEEDASGHTPYFLSEYKDMGSLTTHSAAVLGKRLALEVHAFKGTNGFGFGVPTFCGATKMENGWFSSWQECYDALIDGLLSKLSKDSRGRFSSLCSKGEQVRKR